MMRGFLSVICTAAFALSFFAPAMAFAQETDASDLSPEELEALFLKQKTRGLVLVPTDVQPAPIDAAPTDATPTDAVAEEMEAAPADATYVELDKSEQVNIQISFDFDSAALREDQKPKLSTLCEVMNAIDIEKFRIVGHTDASGSADYNQRLSQLRAEEVKRYLVSDCGIADSRLEAVGVGKDFLFDKEDPRSESNRRVEFQAMS
jgi:OOP family OmpA-OmpF porin